ncbi:hypothetical protein [Glaciecola sp. 1036]|uniref:hypothetical protein n=1 Tax=Alteromonadaceae TaxID=72275 RepID=UPI003D0792A4
MIIQRIVKALRQQDWITVAIEMFIVVFGVYLGILLGNWNATKQDKALYNEALDRMMNDLQNNVYLLEEVIVDLEEPLRIVQLAIDDLRNCRTSEEAVDRVQAAFKPIGATKSFDTNTISLEQFLNNQSFLPFQSSQMRNRLLKLLVYLQTANQESYRISLQLSDFFMDEGLTKKGPLIYDGPKEIVDVILSGESPTPELVRPRLLNVPLSVACKNDSFVTEFYVWEDNAYYQSVFSSIIAKRLRGDLEALGYPM